MRKSSGNFSEIRVYNKDFYAVRFENKWGLVDKDGQEILPCVYDNIIGDHFISQRKILSCELAIVIINSKKGVVNLSNKKLVIDCKYDDINTIESRTKEIIYIEVQQQNKYGIINFRWESITPCIYSKIKLCENDNFIVCVDEDKKFNSFYFIKNALYGVINAKKSFKLRL